MNIDITLLQAVIGFIGIGAASVFALYKIVNTAKAEIQANVDNLSGKVDRVDSCMGKQNIELSNIRTTLIGIDGENGIRGTVHELKADIKDLAQRVGYLETVG